MSKTLRRPRPDIQLFRDIFDASPIGIAVENLQGQPLFVNRALCSMLGFNEKELRRKHCVEFSPPEEAEKDWALFQQLRAGSIDHYQLEKRYLRHDGSLLWGLVRISLLKSHPSPLVIAMVEDITDKKRAEESLSESEERLRLAVQAGRMFAYSWDAATDVIERSGESTEILGVKSDQAPTGAAISAMAHPDDRQRLETALAKLTVEVPTLQITYRIIRPDGAVAWLQRNSRAYFDDHQKVRRIVGMVVDVTERRRAEELQRATNRTLEEQTATLRSQEELLRVFVKNVAAPVAMLDRDMRYLQVSERWCIDYLSGRTEILGRSHYEIFPDMPERWKEIHRRALQGETLRAEEDRWDGQDGPHWARWEVRPWKTPEGAVGGILILAEEITRRKQMEEAVSDLSRKLIESQEQERARIGRELHDDINQRLALLSIELQQLQSDPSDIQRRLQELSQRTDEISSDVQALSHELHASKVEYLGVVAGIRSWCKEFGQRQQTEIDFKTDVATPVAPEIGVTLFRILQEALHNAVKHSGVNRIEVELSEHMNEIHLVIKDAGKGFNIASARQGRGLGLASMEERVRLVNGTIAIESRPMGGTSIRVGVPFSPKEPHPAAG